MISHTGKFKVKPRPKVCVQNNQNERGFTIKMKSDIESEAELPPCN